MKKQKLETLKNCIILHKWALNTATVKKTDKGCLIDIRRWQDCCRLGTIVDAAVLLGAWATAAIVGNKLGEWSSKK